MFKNFLASMTRTGTGLFGTGLAIAALVLIVSLFFLEQLGFRGGPYLGIIIFLVLPALFAIGLLLIPLGNWLQHRRIQRDPQHAGKPTLPVFDLNKPSTRRWLLILTGATMINTVIVAGATYKGVEVMETVEFCGLVCHSVMEPEHTAFQRSSHSRLTCADCHIGPGADWFVKSKLDGAWQIVSVALDLYPRPIPTPLHDLRPARETCEQCHWPTRFVGDRLDIRTHFDEDEANTELTTALLLKVGGLAGQRSHGIHWHVDPDVRIRYRSDETREEIYEVEYTHADEDTIVFRDRKAPEDGGVWREMDCVDCHNRPSHNYQAPDDEIDIALRDGLIDQSLPYIKKEGLRIIVAKYESHEDAREEITSQLARFYTENYPVLATERADDIAWAAQVLGDIYSVNVFPQMEVWWNTYPEHIGHERSEGCYRCHGRRLRTTDRETISRDCDVCHSVLAEREVNPAIVTELYQ